MATTTLTKQVFFIQVGGIEVWELKYFWLCLDEKESAVESVTHESDYDLLNLINKSAGIFNIFH